jgi:L-threonylcarbamoyladenylate synthase
VSQSEIFSKPTNDAIEAAALHLLAGGLVAFPTETVYGLGADACSSKAVARVYEVKARPANHPLIVHIASMNRVKEWAIDIPEYAFKLARDFWPGPMTLVLKRSKLANDFITGGQATVGLRVPDHVVALALLEAFERSGGKGVAAPSANRFGHVSPTFTQAVMEELSQYLGAADLVLEGGACKVGVESTIIDCTGKQPKVLRPGAISTSIIQESTGFEVQNYEESEIRVSGSLANHYAPMAKVILDKTPIHGQGFVAFADVKTPNGVIRLATPNDDEEFAQILYSALREADALGLEEVVVIQPLGSGIAVAIRDRLARSTNGRLDPN